MIRVLVGDLLSSQAQTLVNTVNCEGVMGKGIALDFKRRFPQMFADYVVRCSRHEVRLGQPYLYKSLLSPWILNFPTKDHWRSVARIEDIVTGLTYLERHYKVWGIQSIAVPPLGCGNGGLEWKVVGKTLYRYLKRLEIPVELFAPLNVAQEEIQLSFLEDDPNLKASTDYAPWAKLPSGMIAIAEIVARLDVQPYHSPVGRVMLQKIAYFATSLGIPTGLSFHRGSYGPFSDSLKQRMSQLINNGLVVEERVGSMFRVRPGISYSDARSASLADLARWEQEIHLVTDLFLRLDTDSSEIAATVHFAATELSKSLSRTPSEVEVLNAVMTWKQRRNPPLRDVAVARTIRNLAIHRWIPVSPSRELPLRGDEELVLEFA